MPRSACLLAVLLGGLLVSAPQARATQGYRPLSHVGLWTQIERRGTSAGYFNGEIIRNFDQVDSALGHTYGDEVALQFDELKRIGVNYITFELRTADAATAPTCPAQTFPSCQVCYSLGPDWPQPSAAQMTNLKAFFDLAASKKIKVDLLLTTTHMEEAGSKNAKKWMGAIFDTVQGHPALDLIVFGGDAHTIDTNNDGTADSCGTQAGEAPLYLGPESFVGKYLQWVIPFAISHGIEANQLAAESIIGDYFLDSQPPAGQNAQDHHLWKPIGVMKSVFDKLGIPANKRTYAASFYQRTKCSTAQNLSCPGDLNPHDWAEDRLQDALAVIGKKNARRFVITEGGTLDPKKWPAERSFESLGYLMQTYGTGGANFWRWTAFFDSEQTDPATAKAVKLRGTAFTYLPPQKEILDLGGFHLTAIPNGSFEEGGAKPSDWKIKGDGTGARYHVAAEHNQPQVPSRGDFVLRLTTNSDMAAKVQATSAAIDVDPDRAYTTTGNFRFKWTGDPNPGGDPMTRPQVFVSVLYFQSSGAASAVKAADTFRFFQEDGAKDFRTFPLQYTTPSDAASLKIVVGIARNSLPDPITLDADNLR